MALASSSASASRGASQPAGAREGAAGEQKPFLTLASFNFGIDQGMLNGNRSVKHCRTFTRLCVKIVDAVDADILLGCEVGGFREGFSKARPRIYLADMLIKPFGGTVRFCDKANYVSAWNFCDTAAARAAGAHFPVVTKYKPPEIFMPPIAREVDAVIERFTVETRGHGKVHLITANMHIVCSGNPPSIPMRQQAVQLLKCYLETLTVTEDPQMPVVRVVVGDDNLTAGEARQAYQRANEGDPLWKVHESPADLQGDHVAVCGAEACFRDVAVGHSFTDRGMRPDQHDVVAVDLSFLGASQRGDAKRRRLVVAEDPDDEPEADSAAEAKAEALSDAGDESVDFDGDPSPTPSAEDGVTIQAHDLHNSLRLWWDQRYDIEYPPKLLHHISLLLFKKRKSPQPTDEDDDTAFAPQHETYRALVSVLQMRCEFLASKGIDNLHHVMNETERKEVVQHARAKYENTEDQIARQDADDAYWHEMREVKGKGKGNKGKSALNKSLKQYMNQQMRKRWHRNLQRVCGSKQVWEVLVFSGRFDVATLTRALDNANEDEPRVQERPPRVSARLRQEKAEAIALHKEGARIWRRWHWLQNAGCRQPARQFTPRQLELLDRYDNGELLTIRNNAIQALGHGRLINTRGETLDIGGSTGGGSRRILDSWHPLDVEQFLEGDEQS